MKKINILLKGKISKPSHIQIFDTSHCTMKEELIPNPSAKLDVLATLHSLSLCDSFGLLRHECEAIQYRLEPVVGKSRSLCGDRLTLDSFSSELIPTDAPGPQKLFAVKVRSDGDCLPGSGSLFAFGSDKTSDELRLRIIVESVLYRDYSLEEENLRKGYNKPCQSPRELVNAHAMYSDSFIPGAKFDPVKIYEIMTLTKSKTFMGIWQMFALSSVLRMPLFSMYPNFGGRIPLSQVRNHLHRLIQPRVLSCNESVTILWCSTRTKNPFNWLHNHFVPCVPFQLK